MIVGSGVGGLSSGQIRALNRLNSLSDAIAENTQRLSTLKRINSPRDDPSGFVQASLLESDLVSAEAALVGITKANAMLNVADTATSDILDRLRQARGFAISAADNTLSAAELAANQLELDALIDSIDDLSQVEFGSRRLLDGSAGYRTSGVDISSISDVNVLKKNTAGDVTVDIEVVQQATQATDSYDNSSPLTSDLALRISGSRGAATVTLSAGASTQQLVDAFNEVTYLTGVSSNVNGSTVEFSSIAYGSDATIDIQPIKGTFVTSGGNYAEGTDAVAKVNGQQAVANGNTLNVNSAAIGLEIQLDPSAGGAISSFTVSGSGLQFVVGPSATDTAQFGISPLTSASLGNANGKLYSLRSNGENSLSSGNSADILQIIDDAISEVTRSRASIGAFQKYTLDAAAGTLSNSIENLSEALSSIQDVDIGLETALLSNNQLLQQTAYEALTISTLNERNVLDLLRTVTFGF